MRQVLALLWAASLSAAEPSEVQLGEVVLRASPFAEGLHTASRRLRGAGLACVAQSRARLFTAIVSLQFSFLASVALPTSRTLEDRRSERSLWREPAFGSPP